MATFTVTTTADTTADDGELSLREALAEADAAPGADTVGFDLAAMGGDRIVLAGSELTVGSDVAIDGGTGVTIDADRLSRVLLVQGFGADAALENLTVTGGLVTGFTDSGGGIFADDGTTLTLTGTTVSGNSTAGAASYGGGGIASSGSVTLTNSTVSGNSTSGEYADGGGILSTGGLAATGSTITGNRVSGEYASGGGVSVSGVSGSGSLAFVDCIVAGNSAYDSGPDVNGLLSPTGGPNIFGSQVFGSVGGALMNVSPAAVFAAIDGATGGGQLADNGGPTRTVALLDAASNPALGAARAIAGLATDQRGEPRPAPGGTAPDIGAFELQQTPNTVGGTRAGERLVGTAEDEHLRGLAGDDRLFGRGAGDRLDGGPGCDRLHGGADGDLLRGGPGADDFVFRAPGHSAPGEQDLVLDSSRRQGDRFDLRGLDGDPAECGDQRLAFVGTDPFASAGEVRYTLEPGRTVVEVNLDRDGAAELAFRLDRDLDLRGGDFLL
jgi:CSLREA domain-containing protein